MQKEQPQQAPSKLPACIEKQLNEIAQTVERSGRLLLVVEAGSTLASCAQTLFAGWKIEMIAPTSSCANGELDGRFDLSIAMLKVPQLEQEAAQQLLSTLRNLYSAQVELLVEVNKGESLAHEPENILFGLGFKLAGQAQTEHGALLRYRYALSGYNRKRNWNTPEHWANPENFHRYRW
ncbi:MAG: hypothetical protein KJO62_10235 [Gammaproteobacteria bacterium]|nr:hypothetical protein [Gammaproteobacteria bacterium]NNL10311.1 hypothetical protein [Pseudomonadales bacterium]